MQENKPLCVHVGLQSLVLCFLQFWLFVLKESDEVVKKLQYIGGGSTFLLLCYKLGIFQFK